MAPERGRGGHASVTASGSALGQAAAVSSSKSANISKRHLPEWGAVSGADGVGSPAGLGVSAERPKAASSSRINCRIEAAVSGSAAGRPELIIQLNLPIIQIFYSQ